MVATFHLHCLGHRIRYGNPEAGNTTQQLLPTTRPCCSIEFIESFSLLVVLVTYNIYIYIHIYIASYIHSFFDIFNSNVFTALHDKYFEVWIFFLWNWWVDCFITRSINWCDISGYSRWIHFPFYGAFFSHKNCVSFGLLVSCLSLSQWA